MILGESVWQGGQEEGQSGQIALQVPNLGESPENPGAAGEQGSGGSGRGRSRPGRGGVCNEKVGVEIAGERSIGVWGRPQGRAGVGGPGLGSPWPGSHSLGSVRAPAPGGDEETPSTHLRFPELQLQLWWLLEAKEALWLRGPLQPSPGFLPSLAGGRETHHTQPLLAGPHPSGRQGAGQGLLAGRLGGKVDKTRSLLASTAVLAAARAARTMRVIPGAVLVPCLLLLLHLAPRTHGLAPQPRGEGAYVRWGTWDYWPLTSSLGTGHRDGQRANGIQDEERAGRQGGRAGADRDGDAPEARAGVTLRLTYQGTCVGFSLEPFVFPGVSQARAALRDLHAAGTALSWVTEGRSHTESSRGRLGLHRAQG